MLTPSPNNPLPWSTRQVRSFHDCSIWAVTDANGNEVLRLCDIETESAEQTAEFIVIAANATQAIVWEIDSNQLAQICAGLAVGGGHDS